VAGTIFPRHSGSILDNSKSDAKAYTYKSGRRLLRAGLIVLDVSLVGALAVYVTGNLIHSLLLVGLMLLLLGTLQARDAAMVGSRDKPT